MDKSPFFPLVENIRVRFVDDFCERCESSTRFPVRIYTDFSFLGRDFLAAASLGLAGIHLSYQQRCSDQLQIGVDMDTSLRSGESVASIGYAVDIPKANVTFRGTSDFCSIPQSPHNAINIIAVFASTVFSLRNTSLPLQK